VGLDAVGFWMGDGWNFGISWSQIQAETGLAVEYWRKWKICHVPKTRDAGTGCIEPGNDGLRGGFFWGWRSWENPLLPLMLIKPRPSAIATIVHKSAMPGHPYGCGGEASSLAFPFHPGLGGS
jgi:hypothetical protein